MERDPVKEAPPLLRAPGDEVVDLGVNDLKRQCLGQGRQTPVTTAVHAHLESVLAVAHPDAVPAHLPKRLTEQHELGGAVPNQVRRCRAAEGLPPTQVCQCLQETGLPGGIFTVYQVEAWAEDELGVFQAPEIAGLETTYHERVSIRHAVRGASA